MTKYHECCFNRNVVISRAHRPKAAMSDTRHEDDGARRRRTHARAIINTAFGAARPRTPPHAKCPAAVTTTSLYTSSAPDVQSVYGWRGGGGNGRSTGGGAAVRDLRRSGARA